MNKFFDAIGLALSSIWANKLRSFMMVLGNVVAVSSIIAVVALIQGMNGYVADSIVQEVGVARSRSPASGSSPTRKRKRRPAGEIRTSRWSTCGRSRAPVGRSTP